jgi:hypothetical protein
MVDLEEQLVILYALHKCGGNGRKGQIIRYIIRNELMKPRPGDTEHRQTGETKLENDLAFARRDLKEKGWLSMPDRGFWQITQAGREKLFRVAKAIYENKLDERLDFAFDRFSTKLLGELRELRQKGLGEEVTEQVT